MVIEANPYGAPETPINNRAPASGLRWISGVVAWTRWIFGSLVFLPTLFMGLMLAGEVLGHGRTQSNLGFAASVSIFILIVADFLLAGFCFRAGKLVHIIILGVTCVVSGFLIDSLCGRSIV